MPMRQTLLIAFYAFVAAAALVATWSQNLQLMSPGMGPFDPYVLFAQQTRINPASRSITVDIGFFLLAASAFMVIEARRLGVRFVWLYILLGFVIAISVTFPLFMLARELRLTRQADAPAAWRLSFTDVAGLAVLTAVILAFAWYVLG